MINQTYLVFRMEQPVELRLLELLLLEQQRLALVQVPEQALQRLLRPVL